MAVTIEELGIDQLSVRDRMDLIDQIWHSIPESLKPGDVPEWHLEEVQRRLNDPNEILSGQPWKEVLDELEKGH